MVQRVPAGRGRGGPLPWAFALGLVVLGVLLGGTAGAAFRSDRATSGSHRAAGQYCATRMADFHGARRLIGVNAPDLGERGEGDLQCSLGRMAADHLGYVDLELAWNVVEPTRGHYNFSSYDELMAGLARHHLRWLPVIETSPPFATQNVGPHRSGTIAPPDSRRYADFVRLLVGRYGPRGTFWREHRSLPYDPVTAWQIWSEPNLPAYWYPNPNPGAYTRLLEATWKAVEKRYPHTTLVAAGMPFISGIKFYQQILRRRGGRWFTVANLHDYSARVQWAELYLRLLRQALDRHGASKKPIWVTEFGWASSGPASSFTKYAKTPSCVSQLLDYMLAHRGALELREIFYYDWRDPLHDTVNFWGNHMGLYTAQDAPRPVERVVASAAARANG